MVLLVNQHTVPVFTDIANAFAASGEQTVLMTGHIEEGGNPLSQKIKRIKSVSYKRQTSFSRMFSWVAFSLHYFFYLCRWNKPSKILVVTNPPLAPFVTALFARLRDIPYYVLMYDLYPDALVQAGLVQNNNFIFQRWQKVNPWVLNRAEKIFTLSDSMKAAVSKYMPGKADKIKVIYNWADTAYVRPIPQNENPFIKRYHLQGKKIILYSGNMGLTHDLESLIGAAEILQDMDEVIFLLIGDGGKKKLLESKTLSKNLRNVLFLPYQDAVNFPLAMAAADIGVVTLGVGAEGISVPSKTYINLAAGLCLLVIAPETSELSRLIKEHHAGLICAPGNAGKVAAALRQLLAEESNLFRYKQNALRASEHFTSENAGQYVKEMVNREA